MKLVNNNISPLPFYDDIALQNHRKSYAFGQVFPLITYKNYLLPFQFKTVFSGDYLSSISVLLVDYNTGSELAISQELKDAGLIVKQVNDQAIIEYPAHFPLATPWPEGLYYLRISIRGINYYSEVFCVKNNVDDCIMLEWDNSYNLEVSGLPIDFQGFTFRCYLQTQIGRPEYVFEEEATERMGYSFIESQVSKKTYKFTFVAPEYLCDALRIVRLCNGKRITQGSEVYIPTAFSIEPKWQEQGDLASVEAEFDTDTVVANLGGFTPVAPQTDFNNDFNQDYR